METSQAQPRRRIALAIALAALVATGVALKQQSSSAQHAAPSKADKQAATNLSEMFRHAAEETVPAVVTIEVRTKAHPLAKRERGGNTPKGAEENPFKGTPFEDFFKDNSPFGNNFQFHGDGDRRYSQPHEGMGSGVIIDKSGIILTNNHVVADADEVLVRLNDGREFKGVDIKTDPQSDLAVVRIKDAGKVPVAKLGNSNDLEIGDWVIAVGNPFGLDSTVSAGIISGKGRELGSSQRTRFLQTDAAINPGNSGGPLVNLDGEVIGINTAIATSSGGYQGIGFAIPVNLAKWVVGQLVESGSVHRAYLGVAIEPVNTELAEKFHTERGQGVLVAEVFPHSPAADAGFKEGDVITGFAGTTVKNPRDLQEVVEQAELNSKQNVKVLRDGKSITLQVVVKALPKDFGKPAKDDEKQGSEDHGSGYKNDDLGMEVTDMSKDQAKNLGFESYQGVLISDVTPNGLAAEAGLREGMLVLKVGKKPVESIGEFKAAVGSQSLKDGILLLVRTEAGNRFVVLQKTE